MIQARSIGKRAAYTLDQAPQGGRVLACFTRAWDLLADTGQVYALAWAGVPDGPFNILLDRAPGAAPPPGARYLISGTRIQFPAAAAGRSLEIETRTARIWDPQPDWDALAASHAQLLAGLPIMAHLVAASALRPVFELNARRNPQTTGVFDPLETGSLSRSPADSGPGGGLSNARTATARLAGWRTASRQDLVAAVTALCGLGPGLTPAGDDWLAGWLLALRLCEAVDARWAAQADAARRAVRDAAGARTTILSRAFLACAASGEADADWHAFLQALAAGASGAVEGAARRILAHGATSGAAMFAGFLIGLRACE